MAKLSAKLEGCRGGRRPLGRTKVEGEYSRDVHRLRSKIRKSIKKKLVALTGDPSATMWWTARRFHDYLFLRRRLRMVGWPQDIPFANLSSIKGGKKSLVRLCEALKDGTMYFSPVSDDDWYANAHNYGNTAPGTFVDPGRAHPGRNDVKKSRFLKNTDEPLSLYKKLRLRGALTPKYVTEEMDA